jgi:hypothetical protein
MIAGFLPLKAQLELIPYEDGVYKIYSPEHLNYLSIATHNGESTEGKTFYLMNDIDMKNIDNYIPIDFTSGNFNGNNHKILNLTINQDDDWDARGVFAFIGNSTIENLTVENGNFSGGSFIGGLAADVYKSIIRNVHTKNIYGEVSGESMNSYYMGGLIGNARSCKITNCSAFSMLMAYKGGFKYIGGLIGYALGCTILESYTKGDIFNYSAIPGFDDNTAIGGVFTAGFRNYIKNCYSHVNIVSKSDAIIGGFAVIVEDTIINCYAMPTIFETNNNSSYVGLFIQINSRNSIINNCFFTTEISGYEGCMINPSHPIPILFGKSEAEMQSQEMVAFPGTLGTSLNFELDDPVWIQDLPPFVNNGLPMIRWQQNLNIEEKKTENRVRVYPNPTTGELTITNYELGITNVEIFDIYGRKHHISYLTSQISNHQINIAHLPAGVYFVKITTEAGVTVKKVVKM